MIGRPPVDPKVRFLRLTKPEGGCLRWTASFFRDGYGQFQWRHDGKLTWRAHRAAWTLFVGQIPDGLKVLHECNNSWCVNWEKCLYLGTSDDNAADRLAAGHYAVGEDHYASSLTTEIVIEARRRSDIGVPRKEIAEALGIGYSNLSHIVSGKAWKHLLPGAV